MIDIDLSLIHRSCQEFKISLIDGSRKVVSTKVEWLDRHNKWDGHRSDRGECENNFDIDDGGDGGDGEQGGGGAFGIATKTQEPHTLWPIG